MTNILFLLGNIATQLEKQHGIDVWIRSPKEVIQMWKTWLHQKEELEEARQEQIQASIRELEDSTEKPPRIYQLRHLYIVDLQGYALTVLINSGSTIRQIQTEIKARWEIPLEEQKLVWKGKTLHPDRRLQDYGITPGENLHLMMKASRPREEALPIRNIDDLKRCLDPTQLKLDPVCFSSMNPDIICDGCRTLGFTSMCLSDDDRGLDFCLPCSEKYLPPEFSVIDLEDESKETKAPEGDLLGIEPGVTFGVGSDSDHGSDHGSDDESVI